MPQTMTADHRSGHGSALRGRKAVREAFGALVGRTQRELALFAVRPDPYYLDAEPFTAGLAAFAARHRRNRARLLVDDSARLAREHTRLAVVLRRLTDVIELREIAEYDAGRTDLFLLADGREFLALEDGEATEGRRGTGRREAIALAEAFELMWERGEPVSLRPLGL